MKKQSLSTDTLAAIASSPDYHHKGTQQYFTPRDWGHALCEPLSYHRPVITDLHCGKGDFLHAAYNHSTTHLLGADIDSSAAIPKDPTRPDLKRSTLIEDTLALFPHLANTNTHFDLLTLNPPFSLRWESEKIRPYLQADDASIIPDKWCDSTLATILMANKLMSQNIGEAIILCNASAYERILKEHPTALRHCWLTITTPSFFPGVDKKYHIAAIYLAAWHNGTHKSHHHACSTPDDLLKQTLLERKVYRPKDSGPSQFKNNAAASFKNWTAVKDHVDSGHDRKRKVSNVSIDLKGLLRIQLTSYQKISTTISADTAKQLQSLHGIHPLQLVVDKPARRALQHLVDSKVWTINPLAESSIREALHAYHHRRTALTALGPAQRLGWIDDSDLILCTKDFPPFIAGNHYPISTQTIQRKKIEIRPFIHQGKRIKEEVLVDGQDMLITITHDSGHTAEFLHQPDHPYFPLNTIIEHFQIPDVTPITKLHQQTFQTALQKLNTMLVGSYRFKDFQRTDLATAACSNGIIYSQEQGLGKSLAAFAYPILKSAKRALIVVPGSLIPQMKETAAKFFAVPLPILKSTDDLIKYKLHKPAKLSNTQFFIISYEALTRNGADEWLPKTDESGNLLISCNDKKRRKSYQRWAINNSIRRLSNEKIDYDDVLSSVGSSQHGITCLWKPSIASMLQIYQEQGAGFDAISIDEATRLQSSTSATANGIRKLNPKFRILLTGTPIKNNIESLFHLLHYAAGNHPHPTIQFPFYPNSEDKERFASLFLEKDTFTTRQEIRNKQRKLAGLSEDKRSITKRSNRICNLHHLWKLITPIIIRRRKDQCGEEIAEKIMRPIIVPTGSAQHAVYATHLANPPISPKNQPRKKLNRRTAIGIQLNTLRQVALCPDNPSLGDTISANHSSAKFSWTPWTPKLATILSLTSKLLESGEQVVIGSPFSHFNKSIHNLLSEAGIKSLLLDGSTNPAARGQLIKQFKDKSIPILIAGIKAMAEGHSLECCSHLILPSYSWAYDENDQFIQRVWRLNSPKPVTIYPIITQSSVEELLEDSYNDKKNSSQLALDGNLTVETVDSIDPELLLADAYNQFQQSTGDTTDEITLENEWPVLAKSLKIAQRLYNEFYPPITQSHITPSDITLATSSLHSSPAQDLETYKARQTALLLHQIKLNKLKKPRK